ncbi:phosphonate transport system permease protein [Bacillus mesophilus]|uniref:Phosphonate ABC transporter, permease protein PhnE n=1 Tax=Bacillus mesophilus TaxID=1808955 RepID=A0A6M0Q363_9BACI|nr:phosphonate ABC transporter, permease protein PhnE [Bacillus mesophilus]MBM7659963.1 phosphonate transport system permease protein [Bacillus mesophilus]NEY70825.1 phosphonate ABC transporter, permease protein PhnE [Bacillus mesophilus]
MSSVREVRPPKKKWWKLILISLVLIYLYYVALTMTDLTYRGSSLSPAVIFRRLFWDPFFDPAVLAKVPEYLYYMFETLAIAYAGTLIATVLAIPFGFLAARNMSKVSGLGKSILNGIRAFPEVMLAIIFVAAVGMGPFAGVLAVGISSIGMLGKLYSEVIEAIDMKVIEALKANGANRIQVMWYGVIPQVIPEFSNYAMYRYEIDVRSSTILGVVGAGGIGAPLIIASMQRNWENVGMILIIIIVVVTIMDVISAKVRKKIV